MTKTESLQALLLDELRDLYHAEMQLTDALPNFVGSATDRALKTVLAEHLEQTHGQIIRLKRIFQLLDTEAVGKKCKAMLGLIAEAEDVIANQATPALRDAALIASVQKIEHYEIAGYGTVRTFAELLGHDQVSRWLQETLDEEAQADIRLSELSNSINPRAQVAVGAE